MWGERVAYQARLPAWALASITLLLMIGFEAFLFGVLVLVPSAMFAEGIARTVGNVALPRIAMAASWILGFAVYTLFKQRTRAWLPILVFTVTTIVVFSSDVEPLLALVGAYAAVIAEQLVALLGANAAYGGLVAALVYSILASWMTRALERSKASLLLNAAIATVLAEGLSLITLLLFAGLLKAVESLPGVVTAIVVLIIVLAMLKDIREALVKWDPALLVQLPLAFILTSALLPEIARVLAVLTFALAVFGAGAGLALRSRKLLVTSSVIIGAFAPLAATL